MSDAISDDSPSRFRAVEIVRCLGMGGTERSIVQRLQESSWNWETLLIVGEPVDPSLYRLVESLPNVQVLVHTRPLAALMEALKTNQFDAVISHSPSITVRVLLLRAIRRVPPLAVVVHSPEAFSKSQGSLGAIRPFVKGAYAILNRFASVHIAVSASAAQGTQCLGARNVCIVPVGVQQITKQTIPSAWPGETRIRMLCVSRLAWEKNLEGLIRALASTQTQMRSSNAHFLVVGEGPNRGQIQGLINRLNLHDLVTLVGYKEHPFPYYASADGFVVTSHTEGGPLSLLEALAHGLPAMSTRVGRAPELLEDDQSSVLVSSSDPENIAQGLLDFASKVSQLPEGWRSVRQARFAKLTGRETVAGFYHSIFKRLPK